MEVNAHALMATVLTQKLRRRIEAVYLEAHGAKLIVGKPLIGKAERIKQRAEHAIGRGQIRVNRRFGT